LLNFSHKPIIYGSLSSLFFNTKVINVVTGIGHAFSNKKNFIQAILIFFYRILECSYEKIVFQNKADLQYFLKNKYLLKKKKSIIIRGSGVNVKNFVLKNSFSNNKKIFTFVGRILPEKGIVEFIKAAKYLKKKNNSLNFRVVGSLNKKYLSKEFLNFFHKSLKMNDFIFINNSRNIKKEYKKTDCVVLPSYREGLSRTLLEAASMNKFIVTTKAPGCSDIVINNYNGFTCQIQNTNMLIKTLEKFLRLSKPTISRMSKRSRKIVLDKFQDDIIIKQYLNLINKVILPN
jgi:glycosyltransferase involved in cell wall biosynthesis